MLEGKGVPAVVLGTDAFISLARAAALKYGLPHLAVATIPHPIGGIDAKLVADKAECIVADVLTALTTDPRPPASLAAMTGTVAVDAPDDLDAFQAWVTEQGWSDGLPVLPPSAARVAHVLDGRDATRVVATLAPLDGRATLETIAVNAALAGAGPEHLPVIMTAVRALADPAFNLNAVQTTTHPCAPLLIVNGPVAG